MKPQVLITKAGWWLNDNLRKYIYKDRNTGNIGLRKAALIENFTKYMNELIDDEK